MNLSALPDDPLIIAGKSYRSRLLTGTGKFRDFEETRLATEAAGAQIVTVALRRTNLGQNPDEPTPPEGPRDTAPASLSVSRSR